MSKKTIEDVEVEGKRVLVRVDFNVPMDDQGKITDDSRIRACLPTLNYLIDRRAKVILCSHLDRPGGTVVEKWRLAPVAEILSGLLDQPVEPLEDCVGPGVRRSVSVLPAGRAILLENLRFHSGEEKNDPEFARSLADLADLYINDAFGVCHRRHASVVGVPEHLPAVAGLLLKKELQTFETILTDPQRPFAAIVGGAKVKGKLKVLDTILQKVDALLIGGGMANTFLSAQGHSVGASMVETGELEFVRNLMNTAEISGVRIVLPEDVVIAPELRPDAEVETVAASGIPDGWIVGDIGARTIERFRKEIARSETVFWNGPLGVFEIEAFREGTRQIATALARLEGLTVVGGGSTAEAVNELGLRDRMSHVSTGGGAALALVGGESLPGVDALPDA